MFWLSLMTILLLSGAFVAISINNNNMLSNTVAFAADGARLELVLLENEYGDGGFDSEMEYAEGLFDPAQMKAFHELYVDLLERMIRQEDVWKDSSK